MFKVTEKAVELTSQSLSNTHYNLKSLFAFVQKENPKVAEYIKSQADRSKQPMEVYGTGIVVYLLLKHQWDIDHSETIDQTNIDPKELKELQEFLNHPGNLNEIPDES